MFGAIPDAFTYRWTGSCITNPEYEPEDMLKAVLHALASSEHMDTPFLEVLILPTWDDTPWNSRAIRGHVNMTTLIKIPVGHVRFVPAHKQADEATAVLSPAKWPVKFVLIANHKGCETFMDTNTIHTILAPAMQAICYLPPETTNFFPSHSFPYSNKAARAGNIRLHPLPASPATPAIEAPQVPSTPPQGYATILSQPGPFPDALQLRRT